MRIPKPKYTVLYNNKSITADISKYMLSITYSDKTHGESDEVNIELEDVDGRWQNAWYPEQGATLTVTMGRLKCGVFEIDEIELKGPPSTVTIKGMATGITNPVRTKKSDAHENKTLKQIAEKVAQKNSLTVEGAIPEITLGRVTQNKETDVSFLKRISEKYGVLFSIRGKVITFTSIYDLEARGTSFTLDKTDLSNWNLKDKASGMVKEAKVQSKNAKKNSKIDVSVDLEKFHQENPQYTKQATANSNSAVTDGYAENDQQGEAVAKAIMHTSASNQQEGSVSLQFNDLACAGNSFLLTGLGRLSGKYHIKGSTHKIDRSGGGTSDLEIKRLQVAEKSQQVSKVKPKQQPKNVPVVNGNIRNASRSFGSAVNSINVKT